MLQLGTQSICVQLFFGLEGNDRSPIKLVLSFKLLRFNAINAMQLQFENLVETSLDRLLAHLED